MSEKRIIFISFILIFALVSIILNVGNLFWFFDWNYISYAFEDEKPAAKTAEYSNAENSIEIERIGITAPIIVPDGNDPAFKSELSQGVILYPSSVLPGEKGRTIILGHSAPLNWPKIRYDWIFNDLGKLSPKDKISISFNGRKYTYEVVKNYIIDRGGELPEGGADSSTLVLMSCWPAGSDIKRMAVEAKLVD